MRWLVVQPGPSWSVHDVYTGWVEALRGLGEQVHEFNLDDRLAFYDHALIDIGEPDAEGRLRLRKALTPEQAKQLAAQGLAGELWKLRPDVLFVVSGFLIPRELLEHARRYGTFVIVLHTEQPYELERELAMAGCANLNLVNDPTHLEKFQAVAPTVYAPHAYRPSVHFPGEGSEKCDFAFVGTGFGSRRWFLEQMHYAGAFKDLDVLLAGNWQGLPPDSPLRPFLATDDPEKCLDNTDTADLYRSARSGINLYRREHDDGSDAAGWSMGPREVEMAACGLWFLRDPRPEGDRVLSMLPTFQSPAEAAELLRWHLNRPDVMRDQADAACAAVADRTFEASATKLLALLGRQPTA